MSTVVLGNSTAGLMRYSNVWYENFNKDTIKCGLGGDKTQNIPWRSKNIHLPVAQICSKNLGYKQPGH